MKAPPEKCETLNANPVGEFQESSEKIPASSLPCLFQALDISVLSAMVSAAGLGALLAQAALITALLVLGLTMYTFRTSNKNQVERPNPWSFTVEKGDVNKLLSYIHAVI